MMLGVVVLTWSIEVDTMLATTAIMPCGEIDGLKRLSQ